MVGVSGLLVIVVGTKVVIKCVDMEIVVDIVGKIEVEVSSKVGVSGLLAIVVGTKVVIICVDM